MHNVSQNCHFLHTMSSLSHLPGHDACFAVTVELFSGGGYVGLAVEPHGMNGGGTLVGSVFDRLQDVFGPGGVEPLEKVAVALLAG